jgi:hypothetical protein
MKYQCYPLKTFAGICLLLLTPAGNFALAADDSEEKACVRPEVTPSIPDGRRSSESEMKEAMTKVRDYLAANAEYRDCVGKLIMKSSGTASENTLNAAKRLIDETLETDELLGDLFNQQVRIYKSANPDY